MRGLVVAAVLAAAIAPTFSQADVRSIIQRSVEANDRDWQEAPQYDHFERDRGASGSRTYWVTMILGSPYQRLVAVNGRPLASAQQAEEQRKLDRTIADRKAESPAERARRTADYEAGRRRDHALLSQLVQAFDFKLLGRQKMAGRAVYVLQATPRPGYAPPNVETQVLTGMQGKLWIDAKTSQWVKVEAQVVSPVWIEGFLAKVEPGTRFELEYAPVSDDVWLPTHYAMKSRAKVLFVFTRGSQADESYFGYARNDGDHIPVSH